MVHNMRLFKRTARLKCVKTISNHQVTMLIKTNIKVKYKQLPTGITNYRQKNSCIYHLVTSSKLLKSSLQMPSLGIGVI